MLLINAAVEQTTELFIKNDSGVWANDSENGGPQEKRNPIFSIHFQVTFVFANNFCIIPKLLNNSVISGFWIIFFSQIGNLSPGNSDKISRRASSFPEKRLSFFFRINTGCFRKLPGASRLFFFYIFHPVVVTEEHLVKTFSLKKKIEK